MCHATETHSCAHACPPFCAPACVCACTAFMRPSQQRPTSVGLCVCFSLLLVAEPCVLTLIIFPSESIASREVGQKAVVCIRKAPLKDESLMWSHFYSQTVTSEIKNKHYSESLHTLCI